MGRQQPGAWKAESGAARAARAVCAVSACAIILLSPAPAPAQSAAPGADNKPEHERRLLLPSGGGAQREAGQERTGSIVNTVLSLGVVLGLIFGCAAAFRKLSGARGPLAAALGRGGRAPSGLIEILARYPVGRGTTLVLLRVDRRVLLLSQSVTGRLGCSASFTTLCEIADPEEVASILAKAQDEEGESMAARFRSLLGRFDEAGDETEEAWLPRRAVEGEGGDRAELLDEYADQEAAATPLRLATAADALRAEDAGPDDAVGSLRRRLETLRTAEGS